MKALIQLVGKVLLGVVVSIGFTSFLIQSFQNFTKNLPKFYELFVSSFIAVPSSFSFFFLFIASSSILFLVLKLVK